MKFWQESVLEDLVSQLEPNEDLLGLLLFGSFSDPETHLDEWSDLDILMVVKVEKIEAYFPSVEWITYFGRLYTYSQSADDFTGTTRVCFENFNRIDFVITTEEKLAEMYRRQSLPFRSGSKVIFSRSKRIDEIADQGHLQKEMPASQEQFLELVRSFRFKSMLAVYKVVRNDLLIALHLAQDVIRDCCVLAMMLRDRATGTNIHKQGDVGNQFISQLESTRQPFTAIGILDSLKASNEIFEKLAREWSGDYQENRQLLFNWIEKARLKIRE
jgi:hypothetical protein